MLKTRTYLNKVYSIDLNVEEGDAHVWVEEKESYSSISFIRHFPFFSPRRIDCSYPW